MSSKKIATVVLIVLSVFLQLFLAPNIAIFGVSPNFLLLVIIVASLIDGSFTGMIVGFSLGLVFDLIGNGPVGPMAFVGTLMGYLLGKLQNNVTANSWIMPLTLFAVGSFSAELLYALILKILVADFELWSSILRQVIPSMFYNTAIALAVFPILNKVLRPSSSYMTVKNRY